MKATAPLALLLFLFIFIVVIVVAVLATVAGYEIGATVREVYNLVTVKGITNQFLHIGSGIQTTTDESITVTRYFSYLLSMPRYITDIGDASNPAIMETPDGSINVYETDSTLQGYLETFYNEYGLSNLCVQLVKEYRTWIYYHKTTEDLSCEVGNEEGTGNKVPIPIFDGSNGEMIV
ncbi:MAG: hypothetical protein ACTSPB_19190, partial [Candidatus Thorarchaeota archaeon]